MRSPGTPSPTGGVGGGDGRAARVATPSSSQTPRSASANGGGARASAMGLQWSTFKLNLSASYGIGGARRGCVARVKGVLGGV